MSSSPDPSSVLGKLDSSIPASLTQFDAFPKLPSTYKSRSSSGGFISLFVSLLALLLMLNDIGEYIWGWPDSEFSVDTDNGSFMKINVDVVVNMHCRFLSVDLRDAIGDRLMLTGGLRRDGTKFDIGQATTLKAHSEALSARQVVSQSRTARGFFSNLFTGRGLDGFKPTYNNVAHSSSCRIWGTVETKKITANLHITMVGHGYASREHVDHSKMNLSHIINEFSFGPHFPDIVQPLDNSFELAQDPFVAYQYFVHVVPTTYIAAWSKPLSTNQYSVTHYTRKLEHNQGTPGIFFKFEVDPLKITVWQRTTSFAQLFIRCVGVIGGVFVCMGYAIRITTKTIDVVAGTEDAGAITPSATSSGAKVGLRAKWGGGTLRSRPKSGRMVPQGSGWVLESTPGTPTYSTYTPSPGSTTPGFASPYPPPPSSPYTPSIQNALNAPLPPSVPSTPQPSGVGLGIPTTPGSGFGFPVPPSPAPGRQGSFPPSPAPNRSSFGPLGGPGGRGHARRMSSQLSGSHSPPVVMPMPPYSPSPDSASAAGAKSPKKDD